MPASPTGWTAIFKPYREEPIVGWDELGYPLIVDPSTGKRVDVHDLTDHEFCNAERSDPAFVGVIPGAGYTVRWDDGSTERVLAFALESGGRLRPVLDSFHGYGEPFYPEDGRTAPRLLRPADS
ncbi:hypothetical protein ABZU45_00570 [Streptomyces avermitilis]|uniref:hypothetical protein n=1 Tax=Streptomyces avermitilis TaxID=33903 RepID=UPI0033A26012